jgi:hypothetical protein
MVIDISRKGIDVVNLKVRCWRLPTIKTTMDRFLASNHSRFCESRKQGWEGSGLVASVAHHRVSQRARISFHPK